MAKKIVFEFDIQAQQAQQTIDGILNSVEDAESKFSDLEKAARNAALEGNKALSDQFAQAAGNVKQRIDEANASIENFASRTRGLDVAIGTIQGVAGAFSAVQGTIGLLVDDNEKLEKAFQKVQSALGVLNGVQAVANILNKESAVGAALLSAKNAILSGSFFTAANAAKVFRAALISTGVGAFAVALGLIADKLGLIDKLFGETSDAAKNASTEITKTFEDAVAAADKYLNDQNKTSTAGLKELKDKEEAALKDLNEVRRLYNSAATDDAKKYYADGVKLATANYEMAKKEREAFDKEEKEKADKAREDANKRNADAAAKRIAADRAIEDARIRSIQDANERELAEFDLKSKRELEAAKGNKVLIAELEKAQALERSNILFRQAEISEKAAIERKNKELEIERQKIEDLKQIRDKEIEEKQNYYNREAEIIENSYNEQDIQLETQLLKGQITQEKFEQARFDSLKARSTEELSLLKERFDAQLISLDQYRVGVAEINKKITDAEKTQLDKRKQANGELQDFIIGNTLSVLSTLSDLNDAFGAKNEKNAKKAFENNKKIQIAETLINTFASAQKAFLSAPNPILGGIAAAVATAAGLARVAKIKSTQFGGGGGGANNGPVPTGGGGGNVTPSAPSFGPASAPINPAGRSGTNANEQRVYVLESDISKTQNRVNVLESNSNAKF